MDVKTKVRVGPHGVLLTTTEVADMLRVKPNRVHMWAVRGFHNFPKPAASVVKPKQGGPKGGPLYNVNDILAWYLAMSMNDIIKFGEPTP